MDIGGAKEGVLFCLAEREIGAFNVYLLVIPLSSNVSFHPKITESSSKINEPQTKKNDSEKWTWL